MSRKIFMGTSDIAHYYENLKHGFDLIGVESYRCDFNDSNPLTNRGFFPRLISSMLKKSKFSKFPINVIAKLIGGFSCMLYFVFCILKYTDFIFCYTTSLLPRNVDLPILKIFGKRIVWVFHGTDIRPPYLDGAIIYDENEERRSIPQIYVLGLRTKKHIRWIERWADVIVAQPGHSQFLNRSFVDALAIGNPISEVKHNLKCEMDFVANKSGEIPVRIVHAPTHLSGKGTREIRKAIEEIKKYGYNVQYIEVYKQPHHVVIDEIMKCDFVVDQMYSDVPMPVFSTEAAQYGKPAVVCGYAQSIFFDSFEKGKIPPTVYRVPDQIVKSIEELIKYPKYRIEMGNKARDYVKSEWDDRRIAMIYIGILDKGELWETTNHLNILYTKGCGISEDKSKYIIQQIVNMYGVDGLQIDNSVLRKKFLDLIV
jgi:hypothetical protein